MMRRRAVYAVRSLAVMACVLLSAQSGFGQCGGTERWAVKDGSDPSAGQIHLNQIESISVSRLISLTEPALPPSGDNETRIIPEEAHLYRVQARLVKWKEEGGETGDSDYHLVLTDDTLKFTASRQNPSGHSFVGEIPDPDCLAGAHGNFGTSSPFLPVSSGATLSIRSARQSLESQFPEAVFDGSWNDAGGIPVEIIGVGYFDIPHGQVGRAPNNIEIHPILSISFPAEHELLALSGPSAALGSLISSGAVEAAAGSTSVEKWQYTMIRSQTTEKLLSNANLLGLQGWEMISIVTDPKSPSTFVGYLRKRSN